VRDKSKSIEELDAAVERLREFLRINYLTGAQAARGIGVRAEALYAWLQGHSRPRSAERIIAFLDSMPGGANRHHADRLRVPGIQELARHSEAQALPVLQASEGRDPEGQRWLSGGLPELRSDRPRRESHDEALMAWNGKSPS
jgi:hypothetical protein